MSRNTHDRTLDHHGTDLDTDSVLSGSLPSPVSTASGQTMRQALLDIIANLGSGGGGGGLTDLLTGDDKDFAGTIGNWTANAATIAYDGAVGINGHGSAKLSTTTGVTTQYGEVPVAGTFLTGKLYHALLLVKAAALTTTDYASYVALLGDIGAGDAGNTIVKFRGPDATVDGVTTDSYVPILVWWIPTADRTSVTLRLARDTDLDLDVDIWIEQARVVAVPEMSQGLASPVLILNDNDSPTLLVAPITSSDSGLGFPPLVSAARMGLTLDPHILQITGPLETNGNSSLAAFTRSYLWIYATQTSIGRRSGEGLDLDSGPDYVGIYISERSSTEVEIVPDFPYDVICVDGHTDDDTAHHWSFETSDGAARAIPSMGMLPQYSAAPHSGTETEGESYYDTTLHKARTWDGSAWQNWW